MITRTLSLAVLIAPALAGDLPSTSKNGLADAKAAIKQPTQASPWSFGAGAMWRNIGELSVSPNLQAGGFANNFFTPNPNAGPADAPADRTYDDGFVNQGAATPLTGLTTWWGYQNNGQVNAGNLNYALGGGLASTAPGFGTDDADHEAAPYIEISFLQPVKPNLLAGFTTNFSFTGLDGTVASQQAVSDVTTIDSYALNGVIPPSAPYTGSPVGPGPLILNQPTSRSFLFAPNGRNTGYLFNSSTDIYSLAFGGEIQWHPASRCYLGLSAGAVVNYADWDASWSATLIDANIPGFITTGAANSDNKFLFGTYIKGSAGYQIDDNWSLEGFFRYDWNQTLEASVGPTSFEVDLSGWSLGLGVGFQF